MPNYIITQSAKNIKKAVRIVVVLWNVCFASCNILTYMQCI